MKTLLEKAEKHRNKFNEKAVLIDKFVYITFLAFTGEYTVVQL